MAESRALHKEFWERFMVAVRVKFDADARFFVRKCQPKACLILTDNPACIAAQAAGSGALEGQELTKVTVTVTKLYGRAEKTSILFCQPF